MDLSLKVCMLVVALLLVTSDGQGPVQVALAKECQTQTMSHKFQGPCVRDSYCANVCLTEPGAFRGGKCIRVHDHGCYCTKNC